MIERAGARRALVLATLVCQLGCVRPASAQVANSVRLDVPDCFDVHGDDVRALVALELAPRLRVVAQDEEQDDAQEKEQTALTASLRCDAGAVATIIVAEHADPAPLRLVLDLSKSAPAARTRLLALSIAELIATRTLEQKETALAPAANDEPSEPTPEPEPAQQSSERRQWRLWLGPGISRAGAPATALFGASGGAALRLGSFALSSELQARFGSATLSEAEVAVQAYSIGLAFAPVLTAGAFEFSAGGGVRVGYARLAGEASRPGLRNGTLDGVWFGPIAVLALDVDIALPGSLRFALEGGYTARGVIGQDARAQTLLALRGVWVSALAAVALAM